MWRFIDCPAGHALWLGVLGGLLVAGCATPDSGPPLLPPPPVVARRTLGWFGEPPTPDRTSRSLGRLPDTRRAEHHRREAGVAVQPEPMAGGSGPGGRAGAARGRPEPAARQGHVRHRRRPGQVRPGRPLPEPGPRGHRGRTRGPHRAGRHHDRPAGHPGDRHRAEALARPRRWPRRRWIRRPSPSSASGTGWSGSVRAAFYDLYALERRIAVLDELVEARRRGGEERADAPRRTSRSPGSTWCSSKSNSPGSGPRRRPPGGNSPVPGSGSRPSSATRGSRSAPPPARSRTCPSTTPTAPSTRSSPPTPRCGRPGSGSSGRRPPSAGRRSSRSRT